MSPAVVQLLIWSLNLIRPRRVRNYLEFAEEEIILPDGPRKGERFNGNTQPWARLYLAELGTGRWPRSALTGCTQAGKSLIGYVILCMYHLFEIGETIVLGIPTASMANDKWVQDILPVIQASKYRTLLPERGPGSRNGVVTDSVTFQNGTTLKFMSGGGGDSTRSGFTSRVGAVTEADKMDMAGGSSRETDKIGQIEARTDAFGDNGQFYLECTVSFETGIIWREYQGGTESRIACPCPHCQVYVTPGRSNLHGWREAVTELEARRNSTWACPNCGAVITDLERVEMNRRAVLVHKGQSIDPDGTIHGDLPETLTLGFRFNAFNNLFWTGAGVAGREWKLSRESENEETSERESLQFIWATPAKPAKQDLTALEASVVAARVAAVPRGHVPADASIVTLGVDVGGWLIHFTATAWRSGVTPHVVEYGRIEVPRDITTPELAVLNALRRLRDEVATVGWPSMANPDGENIRPVVSLVDAGWMQEVVLNFCAESPGFLATKGFGHNQRSGKAKRETGAKVIGSGDHYDLVRLPSGSQYLDVDANHWKAHTHQRLKTPIGEPGALTFFQFPLAPGGRPSGDHLSFARHLLAERQIEEIVKGVPVVSFAQLSRNNHWLDSTTLSQAGGHVAGVRLLGPQKPPPGQRPTVARPRVRVSKWLAGS